MSFSVTSELKPAFDGFKIGGIELGSPFVQAALSGYSDWAMRALARRFGASYTIAEVMLDRFVNEVRGTGKTGHYLRVEEGDHPVGAQLMGADPATFGPAAQRLVQAGFDVIDVNFGCPVRTAMGGCRGGYHLSQPEVAIEIVSRVRAAVPDRIPVTVKMRRGIDDTPESRDRFFEILDGAFAAGVSGITVHGRTVEQKYRGPSRWSFLKEVKQHVGSRTILGSGDLFSPEACVAMLQQTGVDGVTIARGAIGNPWIFEQATRLWRGEPVGNPPSTFEQRSVLQEHRALIDETYGAGRSLGVIRKFGFKYARLHPEGVDVRAAMGGVRNENDWKHLLQRFYAEDRPGCWPEVDETQTEECGV
ncbi:tRNA dihydrouridine synthase [Planctomicrobium piriforme]|uniref:tRNA-dihydrouridine synthase n=1 Tax=Planctomicrobium piriforme TaxID=1576369 RepID=A0A1I3C8L8_9PLAN|nr:tRNA-dihydrouridine synthase family protein [Planctomicrobium piriforme]SFH70910.1 tRNA-dihydrouridine synthase B [Planctomicrobium piriforme]